MTETNSGPVIENDNELTIRVGDRSLIETDGRTIGEVFEEAVGRYGANPFLIVPRDPKRAYYPDGVTITFGDAGQMVADYVASLRRAGYGHGHRIAVLLENRPSVLLLKIAFNTLGVSWVPINPDYRPGEIAYLLDDSNADLIITVASHAANVKEGIAKSGAESRRKVPLVIFDEQGTGEIPLPDAARPPPANDDVRPQTEASLLYTSGTTGRPKGCILGHEYELMMGVWYASRGGLLSLDEGCERVYSPLPLFHINTGIILFYGMLVSGNCMIAPERFSRSRWWSEIRQTEATGMHYLGVVIPVLINEPAREQDRQHKLRWGLGAGVEPSLHAAFENRFGFPLVEVWGMTEMCRILANCREPRQIDTRAMGRPVDGLEVRVVDGDDGDVLTGEPGEMVIRYSSATPRKGFFSGYLNKSEETEEAWRGGWFHTGDTVAQDKSGMIYFVDRKKNIIRRSGENIAAAEVEACLQAHESVGQVAVIPIVDEMRDEEVMACVVTANGAKTKGAELARELFKHCNAQLTYYKSPGWVVFVDALPVTGTQKVLKHMIFGEDQDPRELPDAHDLRVLKKR